MALRQELIATTVTLPLPKFSWKESPTPSSTESNAVNGKADDRSQWRSLTHSPPDLIQLARAEQSDVTNSDVASTDSEVEQNDTLKSAVSVLIV